MYEKDRYVDCLTSRTLLKITTSVDINVHLPIDSVSDSVFHADCLFILHTVYIYIYIYTHIAYITISTFMAVGYLPFIYLYLLPSLSHVRKRAVT